MTKLRHCLILPLMLTLAACAGGDKYPYPPQFVQVNDVGMAILPKPPAADSAQTKKELATIKTRQAKLTAADKAALIKEDRIGPEMIVTPVLGAQYSEQTHPQLFGLLRHAASDAWRIGDVTQEHWNRQRPWVIDSKVQLLVSSIKRPGYPSGHSTTNHTWAHVLSELFPNKREALFNRALSIGQNRIKAGVHFPSDVMAGKKLAAVIYAKMKLNPQFQAELAVARAELESGGVKAAPVAANDNFDPRASVSCATRRVNCPR